MAHYMNREISRNELLRRVGNLSQIAAVRPCEYKEGRANGLKAFNVTTGGGLDFTALEGKCLDIIEMKYKGVNLNFLSKPGIVAPEYFNPHGAEFLRYFQGGMLYTCGLSNVGPSCKDGGAEHCLHGRIGHAPAEKVSIVSAWDDDEYIMEIAGEMREAALFNENLVLKRTITTKLGAKSLKIHDEVENQGFEEQVLMILYHFNLGYPMLDEGAEFVLPAVETMPRDDEAGKGIDNYGRFSNPIDHYREQVFFHIPAADSGGFTSAALLNSRLGLGVYVRYNTAGLPRLIQWKSMMAGDYALGIEPSNMIGGNRVRERELGTLRMVKPFEKAVFDLEIGVLDGDAELNGFKNRVRELLRK